MDLTDDTIGMLTPWLGASWVTGLSLAWSAYIAVVAVWIVLQKREPASTLGWILSMALLPYAGFVIYYFFGPQRLKKQRLKRLRLRVRSYAAHDMALFHGAAVEAPPALLQLSVLAATTSRLPLSSATSLTLLSGGAATFDSIFEAVRKAQHHIHLEYYIFEPDHIGTALRDLLIQKAKQGVAVRLLVDALGSQRAGTKFMAPLLQAGGQVARFHDPRIGRRLRPVLNYRTHRKIVVCDGDVGFTGGVNITDEEDLRTSPAAYHDMHLRFEGAAVRWLQTTFIEDWRYAGGAIPVGNFDEALHAFMPVCEPGSIAMQLVTSGPDSALESIHRVQIEAINAARQRAWLTTPYFVPSEAAMMALTSAALRGVDVRVLVPERSDSRMVSAAARSYFDELISAGVKVWEYQGRMLHSKTLLIDENCATIGTANFDNRSFRLNFEVMAVVYGPALAAPLAMQFETDLQQSCRVVGIRRQRIARRLGEAFARLFSPLL